MLFVTETQKPVDHKAARKPSRSKRLLLGKPLQNKELEGELLPKFIALPIFSSDPLSSVAYGPQELLMILTLGGASF